MELSERKKRILRSIVDTYIASGEPVGSKLLTSGDGDLGVSSATIRNEMSDLEEMGYLRQPHTSAGRVPTSMGYKTYVNDLMDQYLLSMEEISLLNELMAFKMNEVGSVLEKASRIISKLTNYTSFSFQSDSDSFVSRFESVFISENSALLVGINDGEPVKSKQISLRDPITREQLAVITSAINESFSGVTAEGLTMPLIFAFEEKLGSLGYFSSPFTRGIYSLLSESKDGRVHVEGATKLLDYPEFSSASKAKHALDMLEQNSVIADVVTKSDFDKLNVLIGDSDQLPVDDTGLVIHPVKIDGKKVGAIGVIGPKRMDYKKVIAGLNYIVAGLSGENTNGDDNNE